MNIVSAYREYKKSKDKQAENFLIQELFRQIGNWIQEGRPEQNFLLELLVISLEYEDFENHENLLELGFQKLMEAFFIHQELKNYQNFQTILEEAYMPFLAKTDEHQYRELKKQKFYEIDFLVFRFIGGEFPHASAQEFLKTTKEMDVWLAINYLYQIKNDEETSHEIISKLLKNLDKFFERYVLLSFTILTHPNWVRDYLFNDELQKNTKFKIPKSISWKELFSIYQTTRFYLENGYLNMNFFESYPQEYEHVNLFVLLAIFELTNAKITPAWIEVFERAILNQKVIKRKYYNQSVKHQPVPMFAIGILKQIPKEDQLKIIETSRVLIGFFQKLKHYTHETFQFLLDYFSTFHFHFEEELRHHLELWEDSVITRRRLQQCASKIQKRIIKKSNNYELVEKEYE
ncbi:MAG: hypothetical protein NZ853_05380 [Leptospiraceae bacterium]|nr:hypothetical protein [Leptospiraceae bacterium]